jgi:hypothetical protein
MALQPFVEPWPLFSFLILYTVGGTPWTGDQPVARLLPIHRTTQTQNKCTETSMPRVGFEPTTPVFERAKTIHALDRASTVIGLINLRVTIIGRAFLDEPLAILFSSSLLVPHVGACSRFRAWG